jgi:hypothetical protein
MFSFITSHWILIAIVLGVLYVAYLAVKRKGVVKAVAQVEQGASELAAGAKAAVQEAKAVDAALTKKTTP